MDIKIVGGDVGISLFGESDERATGSILISDSILYGPKVDIDTSTLLPGGTSGNSLITLDNVEFVEVPIAVRDGSRKTILGTGVKVEGIKTTMTRHHWIVTDCGNRSSRRKLWLSNS
jgi:hypothetical protein